MAPSAEPSARYPAVLLAEHEPEVAELARRYLARAGLQVTTATTPEETIAALSERPAVSAVAVLDLTMPGLDARRLRRLLAPREAPGTAAPTPAVYLLGGSMRPHDVRASADCCLRRPFSPRLLVARVLAAVPSPGSSARPIAARPPAALPATPAVPPTQAVPVTTFPAAAACPPTAVRPATTPARPETPATTPAPPAPAPELPSAAVPPSAAAPSPAAELPSARGLSLDPVTRRVRIAGRDIPLTPAEFALLSALAADAGRVLTRDQLQAAMQRPSVGRAVDVHVAQLRAKLPAPGPIRTVHGVGYILDGPREGRSGDPGAVTCAEHPGEPQGCLRGPPCRPASIGDAP